jgi:hypothetical protein
MQRPQTLPVLFTIDDLGRMIDAGVFVGRTGRIELIEGEQGSSDNHGNSRNPETDDVKRQRC